MPFDSDAILFTIYFIMNVKLIHGLFSRCWNFQDFYPVLYLDNIHSLLHCISVGVFFYRIYNLCNTMLCDWCIITILPLVVGLGRYHILQHGLIHAK